MSKQQAADIRAALAKAGYGRHEVSVRNHSYSMGSTVRVQVKRAQVPLARVQAIAVQYEKVDRDDSGEILSGGNQFVDVSYESGALAAEAKIAQRQLDDGRRRFGSLEVNEQDRYTFSVWEVGNLGARVGSVDREHGGDALARLLATRGLLSALEFPEPEAQSA